MNESKLDQIEVDIEDAKESIEDMKALDRLQKNKDFQRVINKGYLETHAIRQVHLRASPAFERPEMQDRCNREITAIGTLKQYLHAIYQLGRTAEKNLAAHEEAREEMLAEGSAD